MTGQDYCLSTNIQTNYKANKQNTAALKHYQVSDGVSTEICGDTLIYKIQTQHLLQTQIVTSSR